jgi:hypothetical protein
MILVLHKQIQVFALTGITRHLCVAQKLAAERIKPLENVLYFVKIVLRKHLFVDET